MFKFGSRVDRQTDFLGTFTHLQKVTFNFVMSVFCMEQLLLLDGFSYNFVLKGWGVVNKIF